MVERNLKVDHLRDALGGRNDTQNFGARKRDVRRHPTQNGVCILVVRPPRNAERRIQEPLPESQTQGQRDQHDDSIRPRDEVRRSVPEARFTFSVKPSYKHLPDHFFA